jgi:YVTN family beta-propeller protein
MRKMMLLLMLVGAVVQITAQTTDDFSSRRVVLPNGWHLTPAGKMLQLGDLPLNIAVSPNGKLAAVTNNGQSTQMIHLVDIKKGKVTDSVIIGKSWLGLAFSDNGKALYASGGNDNWIIKYNIRRKELINTDTIRIGKPWPERISIAGLALDDRKKVIYAVTKENNMLYAVDLITKSIISQTPLGGEGYTCILSPDRKTLYATCWGCDKVVIFDTYTQKISGTINVGDNPNDMCITADGSRLFVANANDNNVSVIDTRAGRVVETLNSALYPDSPSGSTTNGVALSRDEKTLYIANADNNCLAVFDVTVPGRSKGKGFIPTGWYPTSVRVSGNRILVANGKGMTSLPNPYGPNPARSGDVVIHHEGGRDQVIKVQYIGGGLFRGTMSIIDPPDDRMAGVYSKAVYANTPYTKENELSSEGEAGNPIPRKVGESSPIKYVFYVIKENRTYDQILGDIPEGNGDPNLVLFGEKVTPNHHAIAREFVLLDNFYVNGEVSADGHNWTMGAYATDFLEKNWPTSYGNRGGTYPGEGAREVANNKVFFWDMCKQKGVSYRTYGEFVSDGKPTLEVLQNNYCRDFTGWDESIRDTVRFYQWKRDFDSLLAINAVPRFNTVRFINDHTQGLSLGRPTPFAHVADNDLALGMFVDYLSHSPIWNETLIISVEDDAQNGPDHVDAHRSIALLAGGFVKQGFVDHTPYTTTSLLRTMELVLGLPPMTQYDAAANSLWRCFNTTSGHPSYKYRPANIDLNEKNTGQNRWQALSETFDFSVEDRVNDFDFNEVIWRSVKGLDSPCPPSVRAAFLAPF